MDGNINAKQIKGVLEVENGGTGNPTFSSDEFIVYGTQSLISSGNKLNDLGTASTDLWSASKIDSLTTTNIDEGDNLYYTEQRARDVISIETSSQNYLGYSTASGELSIKQLAITDVTVDTGVTD
jgi:hypothetical protein